VSTTQSPVVGELYARIVERTGTRAPLLRTFAEAYLHRMSADALGALSAEELFGEIVGVFDLADRRGAAPLAVRAFNPTLQADGYALPGSVLETNTPDSPFLVDSVSAELDARGLAVREVIHPVIGVERDGDGRIVNVLPARDSDERESVMHFELERKLEPDELMELCDRVRAILSDVQASVRDFAQMRERVPMMAATARAATTRYAIDEVEEAVAFLDWLFEGNFVFLGYREYAIDEATVAIVPGSGLGILADESARRVLADEEAAQGVVGHPVALVARPADLSDAVLRIPAAPHVAGHVAEEEESRGIPHGSLSEREPRREAFGPHAIGHKAVQAHGWFSMVNNTSRCYTRRGRRRQPSAMIHRCRTGAPALMVNASPRWRTVASARPGRLGEGGTRRGQGPGLRACCERPVQRREDCRLRGRPLAQFEQSRQDLRRAPEPAGHLKGAVR